MPRSIGYWLKNRNRLDSVLRVTILQGNGRLFDDIQELGKLRPEVWIRRTAVAEVPTGVDSERLQIG